MAQCASGTNVFTETFGGSFSSVDIGPAIANGASSYRYNGTGSLQEGEYGLRKHTGGMNNWVDGSDNTGRGGYMMMVRTKPGQPDFYQAAAQGFCRAQSQGICFSAASLSKKGSGRDITILVEVRNATNNSLLANFSSTPLKSNDTISWSSFSFFYSLPKGVSSVTVRFSFSSNSVPDDFAIDDIKVINIGTSVVNGNESGVYPLINGKYEYPVFACLNEKVTFTMPGATGPEFQWERMKPDYTYEPIPGANQSTYTIDSAKRDDSRFYRLRVADSGYIASANCSSPSSPVGLYVDPQPAIESNGPVCEGSPLDIAVTVGSSVTWTGPNGFTASGNRISIPAARMRDSGLYQAKVFFNTSCQLTVDVKANVEVKKNPFSLRLPADTSVCRGRSVLLDASNPGALYTWSTGDNQPAITVKDEGVYTVLVSDGKLCKLSASSNVHVISSPSVRLRSDTSLCLGDTIQLTGTTVNAASMRWSTGATAAAIKVATGGVYTLQVFNDCGAASASVKIDMIRCSEDLLVPTAFSPNKDGLNDVFKPVLDASISRYQLNIYNRWGISLFTSYDISKGWDGTVNKLPQNPGVYVWVIEYTSKSGKHHTLNGTVTLVR
ncbi:MAG: gliding motility-associated C-terminal domain-containing protein [Chitinophagaceae bacterium]|nr:gliding motility-associated C-terminal domain-containing protein [Chitinophagaceae bacterium]